VIIRWKLTVRSGQGSLIRHRTGQVHASDHPASAALDAGFAATPYLPDDF
jgi:hypothetical protein